MNARHFKTDELTGLWEWPVLLNGDWSHWTEEPCAVLFGESQSWESNEAFFRTIGELLRSCDWPRLTAFRVGKNAFLVLALRYSYDQALLLGQGINRELGQLQLVPTPRSSPSESTLTWGIALAEIAGWHLPRALHAAVAPVERAMREKRFGSINEAAKNWQEEERDDFWVCSQRDLMTELKVWGRTVALCSRYADEPVALLVGDVDWCKKFNDVHGHVMGDVLLQMVAHVLRRFETNDVAVFRLGGDEFLVWMRGYSVKRAKQLAEQINIQVRAVHIPFPPKEASSAISLTWGAVAASPRELELAEMLRKADELVHEGKCEMRGSVNAQRL